MPQRVVKMLRSGHPLHYLAAGLVVFACVAVVAVLEGDLPELAHISFRGMRQLLGHYSFLPGYALLYIEESGVPLPAPGDVFVMYIGVHIPHTWWAWIAAWLGLVLVVTLGATNLFFLSRRVGHRLVHSRFSEYVHLSPERLAKAEQWFKRYGVLAIIFGRHIPGFRVPITVASGVFGVSWRVFAPSVAVSTAIWAGVMLTLGVTLGPRLSVLLEAHRQVYFVWGAIVLGLILSIYIRQRRAAAGKVKRPVESPRS